MAPTAGLPVLFADRPEMRVATETIYQAIYVQGLGWRLAYRLVERLPPRPGR